jgi:hypothetical protein
MPTNSLPSLAARGNDPEKRPSMLEYCVPPILVNDLVTQCAAHFLAWFSSNSYDHVRDVVKCPLRGSGGLVEEVEYWFDNCASDAASPDNNLCYWDLEENGPWVYQALPVLEVFKAVRRHTKGWSAQNFADYGYSVSEKADLLKAVARLG